MAIEINRRYQGDRSRLPKRRPYWGAATHQCAFHVHKKTAPGIEPECGSFVVAVYLLVTVTMMMLMALGISARTAVSSEAVSGASFGAQAIAGSTAAFGVFGGFQVAYFDVFLSCTHIS